MSDIPPELFPEILSGLPAQSLLRFRCVCKSWRRIIDDPSFIKSHRQRHRCSTTLSDHLILRNKSSSGKFYSLPLGSLTCSEVASRKTVTAINRPQLRQCGVPRILNLPVPSCDGMLLQSHCEDDKIWTLWNPFSKKFHELPPYDDLADIDHESSVPLCGVGYDSVTDDFKVVRIVEIWSGRAFYLETLVYDLKSGFWRKIKGFTDCCVPMHFGDEMGHGVFADGALHWLLNVTQQGKFVDCVVSLDLGTEVYSILLPVPPEIRETEEVSMKAQEVPETYLDVLSGCLILSCSDSICMDVWKMDDYGGNKCWVKLLSCTAEKHIYGSVKELRPVAYLKREQQFLLQHNSEGFYWFDVAKNVARKVGIDGFGDSFSSQVCSPSLFHLDDGDNALDENVAAKRKPGQRKKPANKRLKLTVTTDVWET